MITVSVHAPKFAVKVHKGERDSFAVIEMREEGGSATVSLFPAGYDKECATELEALRDSLNEAIFELQGDSIIPCDICGAPSTHKLEDGSLLCDDHPNLEPAQWETKGDYDYDQTKD